MASLLLNQLPASAVIRSPVTRKYLRYVQEAEPTEADQPNVGSEAVGLVSTEEPNIFNPLSKIEVEEAKIDNKFVHLRFSHPKKYLARRGPSDDLNDRLIVATSDQPEEDTSKFSCTLFEPIIIINNNRSGGGEGNTNSTSTGSSLVVSLRHVQSGGLLRVIPEHPRHLVVDNTNTTTTNTNTTNEMDFTFVDWNRAVSFRKQKPVILKTIITKEPSKRTSLLKSDGGSTAVQEPTAKTTVNKLTTTNRIFYREIYNVLFDLEYCLVYDLKTGTPEPTWSSYDKNENEEEEDHGSETVIYKDTTSFTLTNSQPVTTPVTVDSTVITAAFPRITGEGTVTILSPVEKTLNCGWNSVITMTDTIEKKYEFVVPPRSRIRVDQVFTTGNLTVPFTYTQRDQFSDGTCNTNDYDDGIFTGLNYYDLNFVTHVQPL